MLPPGAGRQVPGGSGASPCQRGRSRPPAPAWLNWALNRRPPPRRRQYRCHAGHCVRCCLQLQRSLSQNPELENSPRLANPEPREVVPTNRLCPLLAENVWLLARLIKTGRVHAARPSWGRGGGGAQRGSPKPRSPVRGTGRAAPSPAATRRAAASRAKKKKGKPTLSNSSMSRLETDARDHASAPCGGRQFRWDDRIPTAAQAWGG